MNGGIQSSIETQSSPAVHFWALVWAAQHNFRGGVQRTAAEGLQKVHSIKDVGEAKISNLSSTILVQKDVL